MSDRALIIGLDAYDNPAWELRAAVRDALRFAEWVTAPGAGRASKATTTLLLSPHPDRPVVNTDFVLATESAIRRALFDHKTNGAGAERFWFFYAGHGIAPAGGGPDEAPVVVPKDVDDLGFYRSNPIDLGSWIRGMQVCSPEYQVYFVDACRGIVVDEDVVTATNTLFFDLSKMKTGEQARQAVLFATTAGQLANEQGLHGLFGGALVDGLQGTGPSLTPDTDKEDFVLTFEGLAAYTKRRIQLKSEEARRANRTLPTQDPAESLFRVAGSLELARFKKRPRSSVRVFVDPEDAKEFGTAGIRGYNDWQDVWERQAEKPSPLTVPIEWMLSSTVYKIEIEARGFQNWSQKVEVIGPVELHADLKPAAGTSRGMGSGSIGGLESVAPPRGTPALSQPPDGAELGAGKQGRLVVNAHDRYARIEVFDTTGKRASAGWGWLNETLPVGSYRVEIALPTERPTMRSVLVTADEPELIDVQPDPQLTRWLPASAHMIEPHDGLSVPSESAFGVATTTHLGSLLAWAGWAAQFEGDRGGRKLREFGVEPLPQIPGQCFVRVLVGDAQPPGPNRKDGPIETIVIGMNEPAAQPQPVPGLPGFAVQWHAPVPFDTSLTVRTSELHPQRIPLPYIADYVWTIVIVREPTQLTEIHRYLQPLEPQQPFDDTIRLIEQNWRALEARTPLYDDEAERLLARNLDPLSLAVLGYRLALENRWTEVDALVNRLGHARLADAHVLAASVQERDHNMERAIGSTSAPIVGYGYRLMEEWLIDHFALQNMPPPIAPEPFAGGVWTTFDTRGQAVISKAFPVQNPPAWATPLLSAADATARIEPGPGNPNDFIGTGFLIGPRALAFTDFLASENPRYAVFGDRRVVIEEIVGATNDDRHAALARIAPVELEPLRVRWALPEVGTRIAVIGHPRLTFTPTIITLAAFTTYPMGEKTIMPGVITAVDETTLTYECWTMAGVAGGPILDLATGEVIGIHHSGKYLGGGSKLGFGVPVVSIKAFLTASE